MDKNKGGGKESKEESSGKESVRKRMKSRKKSKPTGDEDVASHRESMVSSSAGEDKDNLGLSRRWGWRGNKSALNIDGMSTDVSIDKRKSTSFYGTAPNTDYDYSILHSYNKNILADGTNDEDAKEGQDPVPVEQEKKEKKTSELKVEPPTGEPERKLEDLATTEETTKVTEETTKVTEETTRVTEETAKATEETTKTTEKPVSQEEKAATSEKVEVPHVQTPPVAVVKAEMKSESGDKQKPGPEKKAVGKSSLVEDKMPKKADETQMKVSTVRFQQHPSTPKKALPAVAPPKPKPAPLTPVPKAPPPKPAAKAPPPSVSLPSKIPPPPAPAKVLPPQTPPSKPIAEPIKTTRPPTNIPAVPSDTDATSDTSMSSVASSDMSAHKSKHRKHRLRPSNMSDFDIEEELSSNLSDESNKSDRKALKKTRSVSLGISDDGTARHPDDELLYTLTAKEEIVFRRSISEMRWEEEESLSEGTDGYTTSETENTAAALLWERIGTQKRFAVPIIAVNDRKISLSHLDPDEQNEEDDSGKPPEVKESYQDMFDTRSSGSSNSSDRIQAIFDLMDEAEQKRKDIQQEQDKKNSAHAKLWRRRLIVVVLLNFVMKFRQRVVLFCEIFIPMIVLGVVVSGMILNSDGSMQSLQAKTFDSKAVTDNFDPFEKIGIEAIFTAFCSNEEYCTRKSDRHFFIVYSPANNFTADIMHRTVRLLNLNHDPDSHDASHFELLPKPNVEHFSPKRVSRLIGADNASEVERICQEHWKSISQLDQFGDFDGSDPYEREVNRRKSESKLVRYPMGIIFSMEGNLIGEGRRHKIEANQEIPKSLTFTIRTFYSEIANTIEEFPFREQRVGGSSTQRHFQSTPYLHTGVIGIQIAIDLAYGEKIVEKFEELDPFMEIGDTKLSRRAFLQTFMTELAVKQFEYPTYKGPNMRVRGWMALTMSILFSYLVGDILVAQDVVIQQNRGSIELLKIHGMTTSMRWIANMIIVGMLRAPTTLVMALVIHYQLADDAVAKISSPLFLWLFLWMHACTITCFNYFITSGCGVKKPELAGLTVTCVSFVTVLLPLELFEDGYLNRFVNVGLCFFLPQWNLANGIYYYLQYEMYEEGLDWYDFPVLLDTENHQIIALPLSCNIFLYSTMFYIALTIYMDHILPREFSPRETWLFFLKPITRQPPSESKPTRPIPRSQKPSVYELGPKDTAYGPRFRNVTVTATGNKVVLENISLDTFEGEVTCVVGQIGSGKSDFLNVIAGVNVPSAGFVDIKGLRVHEYHDITNRYVSLCPQKRLLIETLSVEDHIRLCCMLHGASYTKAKTQTTFLLKMFGLMPMRRHSYKGLATNDTKKLMLAMALSKSPSVLLLDNPIDQLDADSRFQFWKLLQELKPMRSIIVTCTTLEEAQLYGDRLAILSKGKLVCYGTPQFLHLAYGLGNVITLRLSEGVQPKIEAIQQLLQTELLGAKTTLLETKGVSLQADTINFIMPYGKFYGGVLEKLEDSMEMFGIRKIMMSQPSLWALFHKISVHSGIEQVLAKREIHILRGANPDEHEGFEVSVEPQVPTQKEKPNHKLFNIIGVLVLKKIWYYRQKYYFFIFAYLPQIILVYMAVRTSRFFLINQPEALAKVMSPKMYRNNLVIFRSADNEHMRGGWEEAFKKVIREDDGHAQIDFFDFDDDLETYLGYGEAHTLTHFRKQTIVAVSRDKGGLVGYYSSNSLHSAAIVAHLMLQTFLYMISPDRHNPYGTVLVTHPFIQYPGFPAGSTQSNSSTILGLFMSLILCLLSAPVLRIILTERLTSLKAIQRMTGVTAWVYWFSHGIADYVLYAILTLLCWAMVVFFDNIGYQQFDGWEERAALFLIFSLWLCWAALPYTYLLGCMFPVTITGYGHYILYHILLGILPKIITYQFLRLFTSDIYLWLRYLLYIFPPYSITSACVHFFHVVGDERWCRNADINTCKMYENATRLLQNGEVNELFLSNKTITTSAAKFITEQIAFDDSFRTCCKAYCEMAGTCHTDFPFFKSLNNAETVIPHIQHDMFALLLNGIIFWILIVLYEHQIIHSLYSFLLAKVCGNLERTVAQRDVKTADEPEDVKKEHQNVDYMVEIEGDVDSEVYLVQDVTKFYMYTKGLDHIYFSVPINAITGLLGLPKSGKTTILEILTFQLQQSAGYVYKDNDLLDGKTRRHLMMGVGYCPQKSCVIGYLTGAQTLTIMGRLRGLSKRECEQHVMWWIELFELQDVANKKCSTYRTGQERRLCCAMALIGDTNMVIFDEPTASMDNVERYIFWNIINRIQNSMPRTVLFASINADEVQHRSSKALLMESGTLVAVGHLTEIFKNNNQGMSLVIRYSVAAYKKYTEFQKKAKIDKLKDHVIQYLSPCALMDEQENLLIYHLKDQTLKLSRVYAIMEGAKVRFTTLVEHFQVYEPSLDDIILLFHKARIKRQERHSGSGTDQINTETGGSTKDGTQKMSV